MTLDQQKWTATLSDGSVLELTSADVTMDENWAPYIQGDITLPTPDDLTLIDPRLSAKITLSMSQRFGAELALTEDLSELFGGGATATISAAWGSHLTSWVSALPGRAWNTTIIDGTSIDMTLWVRRRSVGTDGRTTLKVASAESVWLDLRSDVTLAIPTPGDFRATELPDLRSLYKYITSYLPPSTPIPPLRAGTTNAGILPGADSARPAAAIVNVKAGQSYWELFNTIATEAGMRLWSDADGYMNLTPRNVAHGTPLTLGEATLDATDTIDRDTDLWADFVTVEYLPNPAIPAAPYVFSTNGAPPLTKMHYEKLDVITPAPDPALYLPWVSELPAQILARLQLHAHQIGFSHRNNFHAVPNRPVEVEFIGEETIPEFTAVIDQVSWSTSGTMSVTTREVEEV